MRQHRINPKKLVRRILLNPQNGLQEREHGSGGPGLGNIGAEVLNGERRGTSIDSRVEFRKLVQQEVTRGLADPARDGGGFGGEPIALEPKSDQAVVMRPNGTIL